MPTQLHDHRVVICAAGDFAQGGGELLKGLGFRVWGSGKVHGVF